MDVFRGVAALTIVLHHLLSAVAQTGLGTPFAYVAKVLGLGWIAVDAFFVLSGYLIGSILLRERGAPDYYKTFYARRCFRVLPLYFLLVALFLGLRALGPGWQIDPGAAGDFIPTWSYWVLAQNQFMAMHADLGTITLGLTWSLAVEEQFYLIMPLLVALLGPRRLPGFLLGCMLFAILLRFASGGTAAYVLLPTRMDALMAGVLLATLMHSARARDSLQKNRRVLGIGGATLTLAGTAWLLITKQNFSATGPLGGAIMIWAWLSSFLVLAALVAGKPDTPEPGPVQRALAPLRWLGLRAYGVYLLHPWAHLIVFHLAGQERPRLTETEGWFPTWCALALTLVLAEISFRLLEAPAMRLGRRLFPQPVLRPLAS